MPNKRVLTAEKLREIGDLIYEGKGICWATRTAGINPSTYIQGRVYAYDGRGDPRYKPYFEAHEKALAEVDRFYKAEAPSEMRAMGREQKDWRAFDKAADRVASDDKAVQGITVEVVDRRG